MLVVIASLGKSMIRHLNQMVAKSYLHANRYSRPADFLRGREYPITI